MPQAFFDSLIQVYDHAPAAICVVRKSDGVILYENSLWKVSHGAMGGSDFLDCLSDTSRQEVESVWAQGDERVALYVENVEVVGEQTRVCDLTFVGHDEGYWLVGSSIYYGTQVMHEVTQDFVDRSGLTLDQFIPIILGSHREIFTVLNPDGSIRYVSEGLRALSGFVMDDLRGQSTFDFVHLDDIEHLLVWLQETLHAEVDGITHLREPILYRWAHREGHWLDMISTCMLLYEEGLLKSIVLISHLASADLVSLNTMLRANAIVEVSSATKSVQVLYRGKDVNLEHVEQLESSIMEAYSCRRLMHVTLQESQWVIIPQEGSDHLLLSQIAQSVDAALNLEAEDTPATAKESTAVLEQPKAESSPAKRSPVPPRPTRQQRKVLLIDDDIPNHRRFVEMLGGQICFYSAYNGEEGVEMAKQVIPDVVVIDVVMLNLDGWQVLEMLQKVDDLSGARFIIWSNAADEELGLALGADAVVPKNCEDEVMHDLVAV